jgi:hypothetical protein
MTYLCTKRRLHDFNGSLNMALKQKDKYIVTCLLKARIAEPEETSIARLQQPKQPAIAKPWLCIHIPAATNTPATMEGLLENRHATYRHHRDCFLCGPRRVLSRKWALACVASGSQRWPDAARRQWPGVAAMKSYETVRSRLGRGHGSWGIGRVESRYETATGGDTADWVL